MHRKARRDDRRPLLALAVLLGTVAAPTSEAIASGTTADRVLGQVSFALNGLNLVDGRGLWAPSAVAIDGSVTPNRVYVADTNNNRVLAWAQVGAFTNADPADLVIGQPDFFSFACNNGGVRANSLCSPRGVALDGAGNLYVADTDNRRVLEYDTPFASGTTADRVFGQGGSFTSNLCNNGGLSANSLCSPRHVALDGAGNLYVADTDNDRVLEYDTPLKSGTTADRLFGRESFTSNLCNNGYVSANCLYLPEGVALDGAGNLYVADSGDSRVLEYDTPLTGGCSGGTTADRVFGQGGSFTSNLCNNGGVSANSLCDPLGVAVDVAGNLYVADFYNTRVLEYDTPLTSGTTADRVFGPGGRCVIASADSLCFPQGVAVDGVGNLYVADTDDNRVLKYDTPLTSGTTADGMLGQVSFALDGANLVDARGLIAPSAVAIDRSVTPNRIYVADTNNSRVLAWKNAAAFTNADPADLVIGQPDVLSFGCRNGGVSANSLCFPQAVAVDGAGNLYVADESNNRVLEYDSPLTSDTTADRVFGQGGSFATGTCNNGGVSANSLCNPFGVAVDAAGNLYVADRDNHRVLEYDAPLSSDTTADRVFGQGGSFATATCNNGGLSADSLCSPRGVAAEGAGNLYVADRFNHRVLEYDTPLTSGTTADRVFGQGGSFASKTCNETALSANGVCTAKAVAVDGAGNLYVADENLHRVLEYDTPLTSDTTADRVFGQGGNFASGGCNNGGVSADSLCHPRDVAVDGAGNLYVADTDNHRVLEYNGPLSVCGNGLVESGESCDDGNTANGDCCSSACQLEPDGTTCDDGNSCTSSDACQSGMCTGACQVGTVCGSGCDGTLRCTLNGSTCSCR